MKSNQKRRVLSAFLLLVTLILIGIVSWQFLVQENGSDLTNLNSSSNRDTDKVDYVNEEIGLSFSYPREWGDVIIDKKSKEIPSSLVAGHDFYINFTSEQRIHATLRTPDWQVDGRGSVEYDAPREFNKAELTKENTWGDAFEPGFDTSRKVYLVQNDLVVTGECDAHAGTVTLNAYHSLNKDFKVVRFYALFNVPGTANDYFNENCGNVDKIDSSLFEKFVSFAETIEAI